MKLIYVDLNLNVMDTQPQIASNRLNFIHMIIIILFHTHIHRTVLKVCV